MKNHILLALAFSLVLPMTAMAQLEADFLPEPDTDCDPFTITFVDNSTGNPTSWKWDIDDDGTIDGTTRQFTYTYNTPGNYRVKLTVQDGSGATATKWKEPYVVLPAIVPEAGRDTTICSGTELQIGFEPPQGSGDPVYSWEPSLYLSDPSSPNPMAFPEETITYVITVENVGGCVRRDTITITVNPLPAFPDITRAGNTLTSSVEGATYRWYRDDTPINGANQRSYTPTVNGSYAVEVITSAGCSNRSQTMNFVLEPSTGVDREFAAMGIRLSPNPFDESTTLHYDLPKGSHVSVKLYDLIGREIATLADEYQSAGPRSIRIDGAPLAPGTYVCRITAGEFVHTSSVVRIR